MGNSLGYLHRNAQLHWIAFDVYFSLCACFLSYESFLSILSALQGAKKQQQNKTKTQMRHK